MEELLSHILVIAGGDDQIAAALHPFRQGFPAMALIAQELVSELQVAGGQKQQVDGIVAEPTSRQSLDIIDIGGTGMIILAPWRIRFIRFLIDGIGQATQARQARTHRQIQNFIEVHHIKILEPSAMGGCLAPLADGNDEIASGAAGLCISDGLKRFLGIEARQVHGISVLNVVIVGHFNGEYGIFQTLRSCCDIHE